jgi:hypothetical protein
LGDGRGRRGKDEDVRYAEMGCEFDEERIALRIGMRGGPGGKARWEDGELIRDIAPPKKNTVSDLGAKGTQQRVTPQPYHKKRLFHPVPHFVIFRLRRVGQMCIFRGGI